MHLQCLPIKNYGCAGYIDDPLPNIVYIAPACIIYGSAEFSCIISFYQEFPMHSISTLVFSGQLFFSALCIGLFEKGSYLMNTKFLHQHAEWVETRDLIHTLEFVTGSGKTRHVMSHACRDNAQAAQCALLVPQVKKCQSSFCHILIKEPFY